MKNKNYTLRGISICILITLFACEKKRDLDDEFISDWRLTYDPPAFYDLNKRLSLLKAKHPIAFATGKSMVVTKTSQNDTPINVKIVVNVVARSADLCPNQFKLVVGKSHHYTGEVAIQPPTGKYAMRAEIKYLVPIHDIIDAKGIFIELDGQRDLLIDANDIKRFSEGYQKFQNSSRTLLDFGGVVRP